MRQENCRSLRCSWSSACRRCSNYIFILDTIPSFNGLNKDNCKTRQQTFKIWDLVRLILESWRYVKQVSHMRDLDWQLRTELPWTTWGVWYSDALGKLALNLVTADKGTAFPPCRRIILVRSGYVITRSFMSKLVTIEASIARQW